MAQLWVFFSALDGFGKVLKEFMANSNHLARECTYQETANART